MEAFLQSGLYKFLCTFFVSMVPIVELRGGIPIGYSMGLPLPQVIVAAILGNMLPVPFIILFIRKIFAYLKKRGAKLAKFVERLEARGMNKAPIIAKYELLGLLALVAIPLPGTGAWTGALVAALLKLRIRSATIVIFLGVVIAAILVSVLSYGVASLF